MKKIYHLPSTIYHQGFTLIELLVAISIIGVLSSFLLANFVGIRQRARDGVRKSDLRQIQSALELYRADQGNYPTSGSGAGNFPSTCGTSFKDSAATVTYMQKTPCDPTNSAPYVYKYSLSGSVYDLATCLENVKDSQKDQNNNPTSSSSCDGTTNWSYTLHNP